MGECRRADRGGARGGGQARHRRLRRLPGRALRPGRAGDRRARRARLLRRHGLHDAPARPLVPSRDAAPQRALGGGGRAELRPARAGASPTTSPAAGCPATPAATSTRCFATSCARWAGTCRRVRRAARFVVHVDANHHVDREAAARVGHRRVRQEHARHHPPPRLLGGAGRAGHRRRAGGYAATIRSSRRGMPAASAGPASTPARPTPSSSDGVLDARRCLSYLSQSRLAELPFAEAFEDRVYGCDICQDVCPWNRGAERRAEGLELDARRRRPTRRWPSGWSQTRRRWPTATAGCTSPTATAAMLQRNARVALANVSERGRR